MLSAGDKLCFQVAVKAGDKSSAEGDDVASDRNILGEHGVCSRQSLPFYPCIALFNCLALCALA